ncbi:MAG: ABC transporter permease [Vicinamibacterales bacterium]
MHDWRSIVRAHLGHFPTDAGRADDIVEELALHVAEHHAELVAAGVSDDEALARALEPLQGDARIARELAKAQVASDVPPPLVEPSGRRTLDFWRDVRQACRLLRREPSFSAVAILTLALGIGANTAIFSVVNAVLLRPLPFVESDRLVMVGERADDGTPGNVGFATLVDWRDQSRAFESIAAIRLWQPTLSLAGQPERLPAMRVSANFFRTLGVAPVLGRDFTADDDVPAHRRVLVLSDGLWRRRFGADAAIVGRSVSLDGNDYTVIGVMPSTYEALISEHFYRRAELWAPIGYDQTLPEACRSCQHLKAVARLAPGVTRAKALADIDGVHAGLRTRYPADYSTAGLAIRPLADELLGETRPALAVLMGAVLFVLLIACANVANLQLARLARRQHDFALRSALGASRARLVRHVMLEGLVLAFAGGALGVAASAWLTPVLTHLTPVTSMRMAGAATDGRVLAFTVVLSAAAALVFGLVPALRGARVDLAASLQSDRRRSLDGASSRGRRALIAADVALAVVLLSGAGLMIKSVGRLLGVDPGFEPDRVLTLAISMKGPAYARDEQVVQAQQRIVDGIAALPGVDAVALAGQIPLGGNGDRWSVHVEGRPVTADDPYLERYSVTPRYFEVMGIPLVRGRLITDADRAGAPEVVVIGDTSARRLFPESDPIGERVRIGGDNGPWRTIVGIAGDVRHRELAQEPTMQMYLPQAQLTDDFVTVVVRTAVPPASVAPEVRRTIAAIANDVPIDEVATLSELVARSVGPRRFVMLLLQLFAALALVMTAVGIYAVISYTVAERTREIAIRTALGASRTSTIQLVLVHGLAPVGVGLVVGVALALATTRLLTASLFQVSPTDPTTFAAVVGVLTVVATTAQLAPTWRAMRIDPAEALRQP